MLEVSACPPRSLQTPLDFYSSCGTPPGEGRASAGIEPEGAALRVSWNHTGGARGASARNTAEGAQLIWNLPGAHLAISQVVISLFGRWHLLVIAHALAALLLSLVPFTRVVIKAPSSAPYPPSYCTLLIHIPTRIPFSAPYQSQLHAHSRSKPHTAPTPRPLPIPI